MQSLHCRKAVSCSRGRVQLGQISKIPSVPHQFRRVTARAAAAVAADDPAAFVATCSVLLATFWCFAFSQTSNARLNTAESELQLLRSKLQDKEVEVDKLQKDLTALVSKAEQAEFYKRRLDEASKEQLKLEKALEMKDGQLESFMVVAQRQIKMLEDRCQELLHKGGPGQ